MRGGAVDQLAAVRAFAIPDGLKASAVAAAPRGDYDQQHDDDDDQKFHVQPSRCGVMVDRLLAGAQPALTYVKDWDILASMRWFENLPWWAKVPLIVGGALMSAFSNSFPQGLQTIGLLLGVAIALFGCIAVIWHFMRTKLLAQFAFQWPIRKRVSPAAQPPTLLAGLYVSDIRLTFASLSERHSEISMRVFNGTGRVLEFSGLSGRIKFNAPNNSDPSRMGELPTPSTRAEMAQTVGPFKEWLVILSQRVPAAEADKLLAMLAAEIPIHFDLSGLTIEVCAQDDQQKVERLPIWGGVSYSHGNGFGQIIHLTAHMKL